MNITGDNIRQCRRLVNNYSSSNGPAAILGGGVFSDHCSPISDTTIISSMAAASDHMDHVRTQIPYALIGAGAATVLYLVVA